MMQRRSLILSALAAPFVVRTPGLLMPVKPVPAFIPVPVAIVQWSSGDGRWHDIGVVPTKGGSFSFTPPQTGVYTLRVKQGA